MKKSKKEYMFWDKSIRIEKILVQILRHGPSNDEFKSWTARESGGKKMTIHGSSDLLGKLEEDELVWLEGIRNKPNVGLSDFEVVAYEKVYTDKVKDILG
jgi:hypothetical protein